MSYFRKSDLSEDAVELEVMQGIVRGLHDWIKVAHQKSRRRRTSQADEEMLEGLSAWMRGWKDVEDGFQIRGRTRKTRRDQRLVKSED
ncbi:hypothetical protein N7495_003578 [Penicillium taxi]|uniref:uncharacterized protein n=1 Tax=Penicillium taxi TaxID=168475 RepID=UPI0025454FA1|nr:uncharacterized protein N7495_003578 [Penicillium taxi]KAJ5898834.1 hypothetical protein N7495_003578 [Penicillium taxi]